MRSHVDELANTLGEHVRVVTIDSELDPLLPSELNIRGLPTVLFVRDGREVYRLEGLPSHAGHLEALAREHLDLSI